MDYVDIKLNSMFLRDTNMEEIGQIIDKLTNKNSSGIDGIPSRAYKLAKQGISSTIAKLVNMSFENSIFPNCLKIGKVSPIYKSGTKSNPNNYRPITTLNTLAKIFEQVMKIRITKYLESNNLLTKTQFGFRQKHNTETALIALTDTIYKKIENKEKVGTIFIDLKKAFNTVNIEILLAKLNAIGIRGNAHSWLKSYLIDREQFTVINSEKSDINKTTIGVPQGSRLSPILYLIYVNDIINFSQENNSTLTLFADDTSLTISANTILSLEKKMNDQLKLLGEWFLANRLTLNSEKTKYMLFKPTNRQVIPNITIKINDNPIERVKSIKYLGLILDENLDFKEHIMEVIKKVRKKIPAIIKTKYALNLDSKIKLYYAFVYPILLYGANIYGNSNKTYIKKLEKCQNKIINCLFSLHRINNVREIKTNLKLLGIKILSK